MSDHDGPPDRHDEFRLLPPVRDAKVEPPGAPSAAEPDADVPAADLEPRTTSASGPDPDSGAASASDVGSAQGLGIEPEPDDELRPDDAAGDEFEPDDEPGLDEPGPDHAPWPDELGPDDGPGPDTEPRLAADPSAGSEPITAPVSGAEVAQSAGSEPTAAPGTDADIEPDVGVARDVSGAGAGPQDDGLAEVAVIEVPAARARPQRDVDRGGPRPVSPEAAETPPVDTPAARVPAAARQASVRPPEPNTSETGPLATRSAAPPVRRRSPVRSAGASSILAVLAALLVLGLLVDAVAAPAPPPAPEPVAQPAATSGAWYCPVEPDDGEAAVVSIASAGDEPATVTVVRYADGQAVADPPASVSPGAGLEIAVDGDGSGPVTVRWSGAPVVATWRSLEDDGGAAPCPAEPSPTWHVAGLDTAGGSSTRLHLFNPYPVDASASVSFATPDGELPLVRTDTVYVPAESSTVLDLNEFVPEEPELGATVRTRTGRIVVQGDVLHEPAPDAGGPVGRTLVLGAPAPEDVWGFAFARADSESASWLDVLNPSTRDAAVSVQVSTPRPDGVVLPEVTIPAGAVRRIDLADTSELSEFAVTVTGVNDVPVVATRTTDLNAGGRRGVATSLGASPAMVWELAGAGSDSRAARLGVSNPGPEPVTIDVTSGVADVPAWRGVEIPPNGRVTLELGEAGPELASIPVRVNASGAVVPELRLLDAGEDLRFWTAVGVPAGQWTGPSQRPAVQRDPSLGTASIFSPTEAPRDGVPVPVVDATPGGTTTSPDDSGTEDPATEDPAAEEPAAEDPATEAPPADEQPPEDPADADAPAQDAAPQDPPPQDAGTEEPPPD